MDYEVTIGIPVFNVEKYIRQTLDSALAQTFQSIEFLVLDDCGTDASLDIVREYQQTHSRGKYIRVVRQPHNMGVGAARNRIIDEAQGRFLYFLDSDDLIEPFAISLLMENQKRIDADIVFGSYDKIETYNQNNVVESFLYPRIDFVKDDELAFFAYQKYGAIQASACNYIVKCNLLREKGINFINSRFWEDMAFTSDLVTYCRRAVLLPDITYHYMCRYNSLSNYQSRDSISKAEVLANIATVDYMKRCCKKTLGKSYQPLRTLNVMTTAFYVVCHILKNKDVISPAFTSYEIHNVIRSPWTFQEMWKMKGWRLKNFILYMLGEIPPHFSVALITLIGKYKKLI